MSDAAAVRYSSPYGRYQYVPSSYASGRNRFPLRVLQRLPCRCDCRLRAAPLLVLLIHNMLRHLHVPKLCVRLLLISTSSNICAARSVIAMPLAMAVCVANLAEVQEPSSGDPGLTNTK